MISSFVSQGRETYRKILSVAVLFLSFVAFGGIALAYDLTAQDETIGNTVVQKINTIVSQKPQDQQDTFRQHVIALLGQLQNRYQSDDRMFALVGYVENALQNTDNTIMGMITNGLSNQTSSSTPTDISTPPATPIIQYYSSLTTYTTGQQFMWNGATITVTDNGVGSASTTTAGCDTPDVAVWS